MNKQFEIVVDATVDQLEICRISISDEGKFYVPNEMDGKLSLLPLATRREIAKFARDFADRLECPDPKHSSSRNMTNQRAPARKRR